MTTDHNNEGVCPKCGIDHTEAIDAVTAAIKDGDLGGILNLLNRDVVKVIADEASGLGYEIISGTLLGQNINKTVDKAVRSPEVAGAVMFAMGNAFAEMLRTIGPDDTPIELVRRWKDLIDMAKEAQK